MLPETITQWIRSIVVYMLLVSVLLHLLPDDSYRKYIRIFIGLLLLLLVAQPVYTWLSDSGQVSLTDDLLSEELWDEEALSEEAALLEEAQEKQEEVLQRIIRAQEADE